MKAVVYDIQGLQLPSEREEVCFGVIWLANDTCSFGYMKLHQVQGGRHLLALDIHRLRRDRPCHYHSIIGGDCRFHQHPANDDPCRGCLQS